jgi:NADH-ubiquinone oxidoreductase chain 2
MILIVAIALPSINRNILPNLYLRISSLLLLYTGALTLNAFYIQSIGSGIGIYSGLFQITLFTQLFDIVIVLTGSVILIAWPSINYKFIEKNLNEEGPNILSINNYRIKYSIIVLISTLGSLLLISSSNLITLYLSLELQSFGLYILASIYRHSELAISAGLKYFLLGSLASCIILLGCGLIYSFTGLTNLDSIYSLISVIDNNNILLGFSLGLILIFIGLLFKIAAAPLHNWAPDVYANSATIITTWLTIMPKISILLVLFEIQTHINLIENINIILELNPLNNIINNNTLSFNNNYFWSKNLLLISSLLSLLIGTILGLTQTKIKRLLAYSTISHVGFILLALAINSEQSIEALIFYILQYTITNLNTFLILILFGYIIKNSFKELKPNIIELNEKGTENDINYISELKSQFFLNPILSITLTVSLFSMAGIPPLIGFFSKQFVLYSAIQNGYYFMSIIAIIVSIISASYYLKIIKILFTQEENRSEYSDKELEIIKEINPTLEIEISSTNSFIISTLTLSILLFVLKPSIFLNSTTILSLSLFNF